MAHQTRFADGVAEQDLVSPAYYRGRTVDLDEILIELRAGYYFGGIVQYLVRAGRKPGVPFVHDIAKARKVLQLQLRNLDRVPLVGAMPERTVLVHELYYEFPDIDPRLHGVLSRLLSAAVDGYGVGIALALVIDALGDILEQEASK